MQEYPELAPGVELRECAGDLIVYDKMREKIHVVNETAGDILKSCTGQTTAAQMAQGLCDRYGIESARAGRDVFKILAAFEESGVIIAGKPFA